MADVMIIEDDTFLSKIYRSKLEKAGINADYALDGKSGLAKMKRQPPRVLLLDLIMPQMDGFTVLEEMQKDAKLKDVHVLVLSNLGQVEDVQRVKALGAKEFIVKSNTSMADVMKKIQSYLS